MLWGNIISQSDTRKTVEASFWQNCMLLLLEVKLHHYQHKQESHSADQTHNQAGG